MKILLMKCLRQRKGHKRRMQMLKIATGISFKIHFMLTSQKHELDIMAYWLAVLIVIIVFGRYGAQAIEWLLMKLYEFFMQRTSLII
jgi:hypothetical protein